MALLLAFLLPVLAPQPAYAYAFNNPVTIAPDGTVCPGPGFTERVVSCIKETILTATEDFLLQFSNYMAYATSAACILAISLWGVLVATGKRHALSKDGYILALKIGGVLMASASYSVWFPAVLDSLDWLLGVVSTYAVNFSNLANNMDCPANGGDPALAIWNTVDCALQTLVGGIFDPSTLMMGVGGFFFACLLSSALGIFIALLGAYLIGSLLITIARALYIFISAYLGVTVMFLIAPIILPTILFSPTKAYFDKWLRLTLMFFIQPLFLFAYLSMLVAAFDTVVYTGPNSLYRAIAGDNVDEPGFEMGEWLLNGTYSENEIGGVGIELDPGQVERTLGASVPKNTGAGGIMGEVAGGQLMNWQGDIFNTFGIGNAGVSDALFNEPKLPTTTVDWDVTAARAGASNTTDYVINLLLALLMAVVTSYILLKLLDFIPYIGAGIAGIPIGMPVFGVSNAGGADMSPPGTAMLDQIQSKLSKSLSGGMKSKTMSRPPMAGMGGG